MTDTTPPRTLVDTNPYLPDAPDHTFFSGADSSVYIFSNDSKVNKVELSNLFGLSLSTYLDMKPVMSTGKKYIAGYTNGSRIVAGSMLFYMSAASPFADYQRALEYSSYATYLSTLYESSSSAFVDILPEMLPPFNLLIVSVAETQQYMHYVIIEGVRITSVQQQQTIESAHIISYEYTARNYRKYQTNISSQLEIEYRPESTQGSKLSYQCLNHVITNRSTAALSDTDQTETVTQPLTAIEQAVAKAAGTDPSTTQSSTHTSPFPKTSTDVSKPETFIDKFGQTYTISDFINSDVYPDMIAELLDNPI